MNDTKKTITTDTNLDPTQSNSPTIDEISKIRIEALARRSQFYGWDVSKSQILHVGPEEFEKHLKKQRQIIYKLRVAQEKALLISLPFTFPVLPLSTKDAEIFVKRVNNALQKIYNTQKTQNKKTVPSNSLELPQQTPAEKLESEILREIEIREFSISYSDITDLVEKGAEQLYLYKLHEELKVHATASNYTYIEPIFPATQESLEELQQEILEAIILHKINESIAKSKEVTGWTPDAPKFDATLIEKEEQLFFIQKQLGIYKDFQRQLQVLPPKIRERFDITRPPYNPKNRKLAERDLGNYIRLESNKIAERERMFGLLRFGILLILITSLITQQYMMAYEIADLQLRGSKIGLHIKSPLLPYLDRDVENLRWYIEQQEDLARMADAIILDGAKHGINIKINRPFQENELRVWKKALYNFEMKSIPNGSFSMGSIYGERDERPVHKVTLTHDFQIMTKEVSQHLYRAITNKNPSTIPNCQEQELEILRESNNINSTTMAKSIALMEKFKEERMNNIYLSCPVDNVSWIDAVHFANKLSSISQLKPCYVFNGSQVLWPEGYDCQGYRLPTEAEWEYAARSNNPDTFRFPGNTLPAEVSWSKPKSQGIYHPVGVLQPNDFGLYDMSGNVWEWVWDWYGPYKKGDQKNPTGPNIGMDKVRRGGDFNFSQVDSTVSRRSVLNPIIKENDGIGFRLVRSTKTSSQ